MKKWQCVVCGFIYDEAVGMPWDGVPAGTKWADVPCRLGVPGLRRRQGRFRNAGSVNGQVTAIQLQ
jgi:rubredoxin